MKVTGQHVKLLSRIGCVRCGEALDGARHTYQSRYDKTLVVCRTCHDFECHEATDDLDDAHRDRYMKPGVRIETVIL